MKTFNEWLALENEVLQWAPNKKYFTISPEWHDLSVWFRDKPPSDVELKMMADIITSHGFPTKVAETGEAWVWGEDERGDQIYSNLPENIANRWDAAVDDAVEAVKKYRQVVSSKVSHGLHHDGGERMPYYNRDIDSIAQDIRRIKDNPELLKKMFDGLDRTTKFVLVHDAGMFNADGTLTSMASQYLRGY